MKKLFGAIILWAGLAGPAQAFFGETGYFDGLVFVAPTGISGPDDTNLALCHITTDFKVLGLTLTRTVSGFGLSADGCTNTIDRLVSPDQLATAQSLGLVDAAIPSLNDRDWMRYLRDYGLWVAIGLALIAVVIRRTKSLLGLDPTAPLRKKAATRILSAMCHVGKCDGIVASAEAALIRDTAARLTGWQFGTADIMRLADQIDLNLTPQDYIAFGAGLRDREKDIMVRGALAIAIASGRIFPAEYRFVTDLAFGLGMPGADFRRVLDLAIADMNTRGT